MIVPKVKEAWQMAIKFPDHSFLRTLCDAYVETEGQRRKAEHAVGCFDECLLERALCCSRDSWTDAQWREEVLQELNTK